MEGLITFKQTDRVLLLGDSNSGKTYAARKIAAGFARVVVVTTEGQEWEASPKIAVKETLNTGEVLLVSNAVMEKGNVVLFIDDIDIYFKNSDSDPSLKALLIKSRHRNVGWIVMSRRTQDLPKLFFKQANKIFIWQTDLALDLETVEQNISPKAGEIVKNLDRNKHECLYFDRETREMRVVVF